MGLLVVAWVRSGMAWVRLVMAGVWLVMAGVRLVMAWWECHIMAPLPAILINIWVVWRWKVVLFICWVGWLVVSVVLGRGTRNVEWLLWRGLWLRDKEWWLVWFSRAGGGG